MEIRALLNKYRYEVLLVGILILAAFLLLYNLEKEGYSNTYYAAAVMSMLTNPGVILFNSFDTVGFVTVDKPPVSLWIQTLSAALFGYSGVSLILPQVVAGVCSIAVLYLLVQRSWGRPSGLVAALALTITPIFVAVARTNNMDGLLVFVLLLSVVLAVQAWRTGSLWYLAGAAILIGIGFNIKMIQAFVVIPVCFGIYLLGRGISWKKKIRDMCIAFLILVVVSASWAVMMDLTPADERPYIGSSSENSVFDLISGYNGLNRVLGGYSPGGMHPPGGNRTIADPFPDGSRIGQPPGMGAGFPGNPLPFRDNLTQGSLYDGVFGFQGGEPPSGFNDTHGAPPGMGPGNHPGGRPGMNDGGEPGLFRMGDEGMSGQISWLLPFALIGLLTFICRPTRRFLSDPDERSIVALALLLWLVPELAYFSFTTGFYHTYYVVMAVIPLAGLVGIGAAAMYETYRGKGRKGWLIVIAIPVTAIIQWQFLNYHPEFSGPLPWIVLSGTIVVSGILFAFRICNREISPRVQNCVIILGIALLCIAPFIWSCTPVFWQGNAGMPSAGPDLISCQGRGPGMMPGGAGGDTSALYSYLSSHWSGEKYLVGVESSRSAADLIIRYGAPVMTMGGFSGSDQILTVDKLQYLIHSGVIRYFYLGRDGFGKPRQDNASVTSWIDDTCPVVSDEEWSTGGSTSGPGSTLYDCKGVEYGEYD